MRSKASNPSKRVTAKPKRAPKATPAGWQSPKRGDWGFWVGELMDHLESLPGVADADGESIGDLSGSPTAQSMRFESRGDTATLIFLRGNVVASRVKLAYGTPRATADKAVKQAEQWVQQRTKARNPGSKTMSKQTSLFGAAPRASAKNPGKKPAVSAAKIRKLRDEAGAAGDRAMVKICDRALKGSKRAIAECADVIGYAVDRASERNPGKKLRAIAAPRKAAKNPIKSPGYAKGSIGANVTLRGVVVKRYGPSRFVMLHGGKLVTVYTPPTLAGAALVSAKVVVNGAWYQDESVNGVRIDGLGVFSRDVKAAAGSKSPFRVWLIAFLRKEGIALHDVFQFEGGEGWAYIKAREIVGGLVAAPARDQATAKARLTKLKAANGNVRSYLEELAYEYAY